MSRASFELEIKKKKKNIGASKNVLQKIVLEQNFPEITAEKQN
jgi:hypothetical protein